MNDSIQLLKLFWITIFLNKSSQFYVLHEIPHRKKFTLRSICWKKDEMNMWENKQNHWIVLIEQRLIQLIILSILFRYLQLARRLISLKKFISNILYMRMREGKYCRCCFNWKSRISHWVDDIRRGLTSLIAYCSDQIFTFIFTLFDHKTNALFTTSYKAHSYLVKEKKSDQFSCQRKILFYHLKKIISNRFHAQRGSFIN